MSEAGARAFVTRPLLQEDVPAGLRLCRQAGWNQTEDDWGAFLALSAATCRAAWVDGQVAGTVTVLPYGSFAWIGMVLVDEAARGHGLGTALLEEALAIVGPDCTACLDATPLGRPVYSRLGFRADGELQRWERPASRRMATGGCPPDIALRPWRPEDLGPLVARSDEVATALMATALAPAPRPIVVDVPNRGSRFAEWLHAAGFRVQRGFTRMSRGPQRSPLWPDTLFAILGPEFG